MSEAMSEWSQDHLKAIGSAKAIEVSSPHEDGSMEDAVTTWVIRVGDELFVRSVRGEHGAWYRRAEDKHVGRVEVEGVTVEVEFQDVGVERAEEIDEAYREKYGDSVESITSSDRRRPRSGWCLGALRRSASAVLVTSSWVPITDRERPAFAWAMYRPRIRSADPSS